MSLLRLFPLSRLSPFFSFYVQNSTHFFLVSSRLWNWPQTVAVRYSGWSSYIIEEDGSGRLSGSKQQMPGWKRHLPSPSTYLLSTYYVPGIVWGIGDIMMSKTSHDLNLVCNARKWDIIQMNFQTNLQTEEYENIEQEFCLSLTLREGGVRESLLWGSVLWVGIWRMNRSC